MSERTTCLVAGGGPAGMVLGLLLARAGVEVTVLEKHADFLRDFRGDTVHPSTLTLLDELGLGERFGKLPQSRLDTVSVPGPPALTIADFRKLKVAHPMSRWFRSGTCWTSWPRRAGPSPRSTCG